MSQRNGERLFRLYHLCQVLIFTEMKKQIHLLLIFTFLGLVLDSCNKEDTTLPEACFVASEERKVGVPIEFSTSCSVNASSYHWNFGDGQSSEEAYPNHTYNEGGDYPVTLTVANSNGATDEVTHIMVVEAPV